MSTSAVPRTVLQVKGKIISLLLRESNGGKVLDLPCSEGDRITWRAPNPARLRSPRSSSGNLLLPAGTSNHSKDSSCVGAISVSPREEGFLVPTCLTFCVKSRTSTARAVGRIRRPSRRLGKSGDAEEEEEDDEEEELRFAPLANQLFGHCFMPAQPPPHEGHPASLF